MKKQIAKLDKLIGSLEWLVKSYPGCAEYWNMLEKAKKQRAELAATIGRHVR